MTGSRPDVVIDGRPYRWFQPDGYVQIDDNGNVIEDAIAE